MIDLTAAMFTHLSALPAVAAVFGTYEDLPAFFEERAPNGFEITDPVLVIDYPHGTARDETSTCTGRAVDMRLRVYGRVAGENGATGYAALNLAAETLADTLHNSQPAIDGGRTSRVAVNGPHRAPTDTPNIGGRVISIRWNITET